MRYRRIVSLSAVVGLVMAMWAPGFAVAQESPDLPLVFAHRGAPGYIPEHTEASYLLAIQMGADYIEPDLVMTQDGEFIVRHENIISDTTDVADRPEFADRLTTKIVEGSEQTGWFTEDFTLAELKTLRAVERLPDERPANTIYDGMFELLTFQEAIDIAQEHGVGIFPELKKPTWFREIGLPMEEQFVQILEANGYTESDDPAILQSFDPASVMLLDDLSELPVVFNVFSTEGVPYAFQQSGDPRTYGDLLTPAGLDDVRTWADGLGLNKDLLIPRDEQGFLQEPTGLYEDARAAGLEIYVYTFRNENAFLPADFQRGDPDSPYFGQAIGDPAAEYELFYELGVDGVWSDQPDTAVGVRRYVFLDRAEHDIESNAAVSQRVAGSNRYETAAAIATATFPDGATDVVLATGENYPDALAAAGLAGRISGPVLLTPSDELPEATSSALESLGATTVHIVGGPAAVSQGVEDDLDVAGFDTPRHFGDDRYETAAEIAEAIGGENVAGATAIIATGRNFPDAIAGGPLAYAGPHPVLLVSDEVPQATQDALTNLGITDVVVLGGTRAVTGDVEAQLASLTGDDDVLRLSGDDREETAAEIARYVVQNAGFGVSTMLLANGRENLGVDALAGAPHGGVTMSPVLLATADDVPAGTASLLTEQCTSVDTVRALGGTAVISDTTLAVATAAASCAPAAPMP